MAAETETQSAVRRKRVRMLKRLIIISLITVILIPIILCGILFGRISNLEKQLDDLEVLVNRVAQTQADMSKEDVQQTTDSDSVTGSMNGEIAQGNVDTEASDLENTLLSSNHTEEETIEPVRKVYLTFDDGPSSNTANILDILDAYGVKATFFVNGKEGEWAEEAYQRIVEEGHTLGMHSYTHKYEEIYASTEAFTADVHRLQDYLYEVTGVKTKYYRFPGGSSNDVSRVRMRDLIECLYAEDIMYYDWNVSSQDATNVRYTAEELVNNCLAGIEKHDTVILLMHDAAEKDNTVAALPMLIEKIQAMENTELLAIADDTVPVQHIKITQEETEE